MKKLALTAKSLVLLLSIGAVACSDSNNKPAAIPAATTEAAPASSSLNIRYVDSDSISLHYNLAKDFQELSIKALSKLENARQSRATEIQRFGQQIEEKMRSNGYLSEDSYNADVAKFNKMQQDAQNYLANLERNTQQELDVQRQQLNDSIESFIKSYNAVKGYDAILYRAAGIYFNPTLDITNEVIEGLNARYNKVSTEK